MAMETERQKQTHIIFRFYKVNDGNGDGEGNKMGNGTKLDGVGPVDNRPSTDKLHHFVRKNKKK